MSASQDSAKTAASPAKKSKTPATKKSKSGAKKAGKTAAAHPAFADMAIAAIQELKEKKGSSLIAIKKFVAAKYKLKMTSTSTTGNYLRKAVR